MSGSLLPWLLAWVLLMAASAAVPWLATTRPAMAGSHRWPAFLVLQALGVVPAVASWWVALKRRLDMPRGLFLLAVFPLVWSLLLGAAFAALVFVAS